MRERLTEATDDAAALTVPLSLAAFSATVDQWQAALFAFLHGLLGDAEQARDLTQDTFHDAWRATQTISPPWTAAHDDDERRRWLFHTAYCRAISQLRRRQVIRWASLDWASLATHDAATNGGAAARATCASLADDADSFEQRVAEADALRAALARLSPDDVACLLLLHYDGAHWTQVPAPLATPTSSDRLQHIVATGPDSIWVTVTTNAGTILPSGVAFSGSFLHYDGTAWSEVTPSLTALKGITSAWVAAASPARDGTLWVVGGAELAQNQHGSVSGFFCLYANGAWSVVKPVVSGS
jgi:DNA-directed RNA polymerase specialized sigma24 family protein